MFDILRNKIKGFTDRLKQKINLEQGQTEKKPKSQEPFLEEQSEKSDISQSPLPEEPPFAESAEPLEEKEEKIPKSEEKILELEKETELLPPEAAEKPPETAEEPSETAEETSEIKEIEKKELDRLKVEDKREIKAAVSATSKIKSFFSSQIALSEKDLDNLLYDFELALLESDVDQDTSTFLCGKIKKELLGKKIPKGKDFDNFIKQEIKKVFAESITVEHQNIISLIKTKTDKPFVILFLGPNGAGKSTSMAKLTNILQKKNFSVIWSASDTFRAAAIEQLEKHAERLNVRLIKHKYGSDPAAVAFDAVNAAKAKKIDVVLIDSAGRQDTNQNLMEELKKIVRVIKPDLKIFVGEALSGRSLLEQAKVFDKELNIDGFVLTKIDTDTKGGTSISLLHTIKKPIFYVGIGQGYDDLIEFNSDFIVNRIV
ncbi:MAG: signal recognition particle-docking protein FtsY [Candidatus Diapherotrites archaeon CG08_land_8_20_14_0_20_34_12]|nr:MAG: signal recognition particle-docking protein FtsY [Candidatus Diapherotrites archaeon CG08_land_8_20_14_0_20_34_12]